MKQTKNVKRMVWSVIAIILLVLLYGCASQNQICNHSYYLSNYSAGSGSVNGYNEYTCSNCGNSYREIIPAKSASSDDNTELEDLTRKKAVSLFDLPVYSDKNVFSSAVNSLSYCSEKTDVDGWKHTNCYQFCGSPHECWVRYELDGKYNTLSGKIFDYNDEGGTGWLEFYDGEDFVATSPKIGEGTSSAEFEIDISDVQYLTVHFRATEVGTWMIADKLIVSK